MGNNGQETDWSEWIRELDDPINACSKQEALEHITVLDCSHANLAGCFAGSTLAELGAEVIRIEPPGGDPARTFSPWGYRHMDTGLGYLNEGRNKFHITLDLERQEGREVFKKLARRADIIIETFLPGVMDERGIGYRQLCVGNPGLIYCALYTYGQFGPKAGCGKADLDVVDQAYSGVSAVTGEPVEDRKEPKRFEAPTKQGNWMGWYAGGAWASIALMAALHYRNQTGKGQFIDVSPAEALGRCINYSLTYYQEFRETIPRVGNFDVGVFPYTYFKCKDGYVFLSGFSDINWKALCTILSRPDLQERYPTIYDRLRIDNMKVMYKEIEEWTAARTYKEIYEAVMDYNSNGGEGVVAPARVTSPAEILLDENWWMRGAFERVDDPHYGKMVIANQPWKMTETPPRVKWMCRPVGADNEYVYNSKLGWGQKQLKELKDKGII
jgi:crotonobetainyl-CoA:carnitine CoA-transferase CaiB-like acyl-CoA transferase